MKKGQEIKSMLKQINDDVDDTKKASVTFTVPASNKVWVSMKTSIRDFDSTEKIFYVRVTDSDSESTQGSWGAGNFNDEQVAGYYEEDFSIHIFQWYFDYFIFFIICNWNWTTPVSLS